MGKSCKSVTPDFMFPCLAELFQDRQVDCSMGSDGQVRIGTKQALQHQTSAAEKKVLEFKASLSKGSTCLLVLGALVVLCSLFLHLWGRSRTTGAIDAREQSG